MFVTLSLPTQANQPLGERQSVTRFYGLYYNGECQVIIGRNNNNIWLKIRTEDEHIGWVATNLTKVVGDLGAVPVVDQ